MAKSKRNIGDFQKAMLSNAKVIGSKDSDNGNEGLAIKQETLDKLQAMAKKHNVPVESLLQTALDMFVKMEGYFFDSKKN